MVAKALFHMLEQHWIGRSEANLLNTSLKRTLEENIMLQSFLRCEANNESLFLFHFHTYHSACQSQMWETFHPSFGTYTNYSCTKLYGNICICKKYIYSQCCIGVVLLNLIFLAACFFLMSASNVNEIIFIAKCQNE